MKQSLGEKFDQLLIAAAILLPLWWLCFTIAYLLDYSRQKREATSRPPLSDELKAEIAEYKAGIPSKQWGAPSWADLHPKRYPAYLTVLLFYVPFIVLFLPVIIVSKMLS